MALPLRFSAEINQVTHLAVHRHEVDNGICLAKLALILLIATHFPYDVILNRDIAYNGSPSLSC